MDNVLDSGKQEIEPYSVGLRCFPMGSFDYVSLASTIKWTFSVVMKWMQSVLISAFVGIALAFACFSVAAMLAHRREYIYLGGLLSSGVSMLMWLHFASIFGGSATIFKFKHQERRDEEYTAGTFGWEGLTKREQCHKDVPVVLIDMHSCCLEAKIKMNLDFSVTEVKEKPAEK